MAVTMFSIDAVGQSVRTSNAESGLVGVKLYDTGQKVISMYGSPIEVQPVTFGTSAIGPGGGGGGGRPGAPSAAGAAGRGGGGQAAEALGMRPGSFNDLGFGNEFLFQKGPGGEDGEGPRGSAGPGRPAPSGAGGGGGGMGGGGASADNVVYTRWIYKRGMSKYGFILDKANRVVQIEAIGMQDGRVKTRKGAGFGSSFGTLIKMYGTPDGYDINGDTIVVRFLQRNKVAFRLNRLAKDKPHQVTGVVVAGGKL